MGVPRLDPKRGIPLSTCMDAPAKQGFSKVGFGQSGRVLPCIRPQVAAVYGRADRSPAPGSDRARLAEDGCGDEAQGRDAGAALGRILRRASDGYGYTWFCERYREFENRISPRYRNRHEAGAVMQTDYTGHTIPVIDPGTGAEHRAQIFVAVPQQTARSPTRPFPICLSFVVGPALGQGEKTRVRSVRAG